MAQARKLEQMKKDLAILSKHPSKIFYSENNYMTYVKDSSYGRGLRKLRAKTLDELNAKIIEFYKNCEDNPTVNEAFDSWMDERVAYHEVKIQSITRMKNGFKRYFTSDKKITRQPINTVTENELTEFIKSTIVQFNMSRKQYADFRTIVRGLWRYSKDRGWTKLNIVEFFQEIYLPKGLFRKPESRNKSKVFTHEECEKLTDYLSQSNYLTDFGLLLQFQTGLRVGELSSLKWIDIHEDYIHVQRTEVHYQENGHDKKTVQDLTKTEAGDREVVLTKNAQQTIHKIRMKNPFGEFVFERSDHTRIAESCFNRRLGIVCKRLGIEHSSSHKIRRTFATNLIDSGTDESLIKETLGHSDITTTRKYYYFADQSLEEKKEQIERAIPY
jgi:integrase